MNVTMSIDERVVAEARRIAAARGTSLNQLVRDFLNELTRADEVNEMLNKKKKSRAFVKKKKKISCTHTNRGANMFYTPW